MSSRPVLRPYIQLVEWSYNLVSSEASMWNEDNDLTRWLHNERRGEY